MRQRDPVRLRPVVPGRVVSGLLRLGLTLTLGLTLGLALLGQGLAAHWQSAAAYPAQAAPAAVSGVAAGVVSGTASGAGATEAAGASQGAVSVCFKPGAGAARDTVLVIPSGTVFAGSSAPVARNRSTPMEGVVTTETVTLTDMQPCSGADASSVVSRTRHWLVDPVRPQPVVLRPVGEVSGNGVDTAFGNEPDSFRSAVKTGALTARVQAVLKETVYLTETPADIPPVDENAMGPDWAQPDGQGQKSLRSTPGSRTE
ncbi:hypothetical protein OQ252_01435 [Acetobacter farinalis]|uniref:Uncharacterized protein n=1 Tax=Acetobacter farinalis TaxID=1260984 RepID=A0ABT3Q453_9PROT|nr:hypothetical protein [Acetobacter farinalis]MCX2560066.1 hypothetical protein [Acetobacter farinalis]NHO28721.1 hypothetical protein [Acetobacter farinalis]